MASEWDERVLVLLFSNNSIMRVWWVY